MGKEFTMGTFAKTLHVVPLDGTLQPGPRTIETVTTEIITLRQTAGDAIIGIGQRLIEAKELLGHGEWLPWLTEQVEFSERSAQNLMRLAREWSNPQTLADLGASKALQLLALPPDERETFIAENHLVNGEEKTVIDMSARELEKAIRERDEARAAMEHAEAGRAKMAADMAVLKQLLYSAQCDVNNRDQALAEAEEALQALRAQPVDVAVMAVDQESLDKARAEAVAEMQAKVDKAVEAKQKAEEKRKAAEAALEKAKTEAVADMQSKLSKAEAELKEAKGQLETARKQEKQAVLAGDGDFAAFKILFDQSQEMANKMRGILIKMENRGEAGMCETMRKALGALADAIGKGVS